MASRRPIPPVRILPETVANKIAAGEVVERPASVVKELVENALDAGATRIAVRAVGAGRRTIEVTDNGHGMSEQDALLAIERHATSKIRKAEDLDNVATLGFRGEALASIAAVSRFELVTRREKDAAGTRIQIDGGILRDTGQAGAPPGTRVTVNRLYFNTPVRAKFLKGVTTELSHCVDVVQRHALAHEGVGFSFEHNGKLILDIPAHADLRERIALIWGLNFVKEMVPVRGEAAGLKVRGFAGSPALTRSSRSHQFFFINGRPVMNPSLQFGFEDAYQGLLTIGRRPVCILLCETHPRYVDVNIHPTKREIRFRDERAVRIAIRDIVRDALEDIREQARSAPEPAAGREEVPDFIAPAPVRGQTAKPALNGGAGAVAAETGGGEPREMMFTPPSPPRVQEPVRQIEFAIPGARGSVAPEAVYEPIGEIAGEPIQVFDSYLLVPEDDRLLIIDQHALHERLNFDSLLSDLEDANYASQQLVVPILFQVTPAQAKILESHLDLFAKLGMEIEPFGGETFQVRSLCQLYDENRVKDAIYHILDELGQGNLFDREDFLKDFLRLASEACRASVKAGDKLTAQEKLRLVEGFRRLRPPYTCPHGRPIITELTIAQMEKSFRRRQ